MLAVIEKMWETLNILLTELQSEGTNCGGNYHFSKLELPEGVSLEERLKNYLLQIKAYNHPYIKIGNSEMIVNDRLVDNLFLEKVIDVHLLINEKLKYWREHRTSLDCRDENTNQYEIIENRFKEFISQFLNSLTELNTYLIKGIDTYFAPQIGGDHVNDDIIFESRGNTYILRFGWSS